MELQPALQWVHEAGGGSYSHRPLLSSACSSEMPPLPLLSPSKFYPSFVPSSCPPPPPRIPFVYFYAFPCLPSSWVEAVWPLLTNEM